MTRKTTNSSHPPIDLLTSDPKARVALTGIAIHSHLTPLGHLTRIEQTFVNHEKKPIEAVYTFPLPDKAAVCGLEVRTGDRLLTGTIEDIEKAIEQHEKTLAGGHGSTLLEQHRPDVFSVSVGNLKPGQAATIVIHYICEVQTVDKLLRVSFPTTLAPRYATSTASDPAQAQIDGDILNPPHVLSVPYGLTLDLEIDLGRPLSHIASPTHAVKVEELQGNRQRVRLAGGAAQTDCDIVIEMQLTAEPKPTAITATGSDGATYVAATFVPEFEEVESNPNPSNVVFLIDCSGSMQGDSIAQARIALSLCLRSLKQGDRFNICRFGSSHQWMSSEPLVYDTKSLRQALEYVTAMKADLSGTEIHPPLAEICGESDITGGGGYFARRSAMRQAVAATRQGRIEGAEKQVIVLTDGQVSNEPAVIELVRRHREQVRIFSFGIGSSSSQYLVRGLAEATGGASEFIAPGERIEEKVLRTFSRLGGLMARDVKIEWGAGTKAKVTMAPEECPPLFEGDAVTLVARVERAKGKSPRQFQLGCKVGERTQSWKVEIPEAVEDGGTLSRLWARRVMATLENQPGHSRAEVVELSRRFGVLCSQTAMIAIEHRSAADRDAGLPALRRIPVQLARGWHGIDVDAAMESSMLCTIRLADASVAKFSGSAEYFSKKGFDIPSPAQPDTTDLVLEVLMAQEAEGWFGPGALACLQRNRWIAKRQANKIDEFLATSASHLDSDANLRLQTTIKVLLVLKSRFGNQVQFWQRAAEKAFLYVANVLARSPGEIETLVNELGCG